MKNPSSYRSKHSAKPGRLFSPLPWIGSLLLGAICAIAIPLEAAERIYFNYGPLRLSIRVDSLEEFARDGTINQELAFYLGDVNPEQRQQFREALLQRSELNPVQLYRFFKTSIGEDILEGIGQLIRTPGGRNGKYPLRGALFQAASDSEGLTLLNFLRKFPTDIQLDTDEIFAVAEKVQRAVEVTAALVEKVSQLSDRKARKDRPVNFAALPDLRVRGSYGVEKQVLTLRDESRDRTLTVYLYKPQRWRPEKTPVVIMSHGLGSRPKDFSARAEHLASHGYFVALPQHPGSDLTRFQETLAGYYRDIFSLDEFVDRPLDISFIIDELQKRDRTEFEGRLNLEEVGVLGHSFGGYTALAVAGAQIDFDNLKKSCDAPDWDPNLSLLLQCRALALPRKNYNFKDPRVKAVIAVNPVNSSIFGPQGLSQIQIPVLVVAGSYDPATPAVFEQIRSFPWLSTPNKYLAVAEGQAHVDFSQLDAGASQLLNSLPNLTFPDPILIDNYADAMGLAFFEVYVADDANYSSYLQSSYAAYLSRENIFKLYLVDSASATEIVRALAKFNLNN
ncbi:alpha/beta hydrolase [Hydrococcus rivularis]|uniref:alpha/beta hydrolase n=1 Tax=Hydrococcus rivularis TaxID=1616834 RepID=UPI0009F8E834|nr:alpha/beta hydrolase [Hydrococcus rivularis]